MTVTIGVDPGSATGGLALFNGRCLVDVKPLPTVATVVPVKGAEVADLIGRSATRKTHRLDTRALADILREWAKGCAARVVCERMSPRPLQGVVSTAHFAEAYGSILGIAAALGLEFVPVDAATWKRSLGLGADKDASRQRAAELFPRWEPLFRPKGSHHQAEAVLVGWYAVTNLD